MGGQTDLVKLLTSQMDSKPDRKNLDYTDSLPTRQIGKLLDRWIVPTNSPTLKTHILADKLIHHLLRRLRGGSPGSQQAR